MKDEELFSLISNQYCRTFSGALYYMTGPDLEKLVGDQFAELARLSRTKGREYTRGADDRLANFKRAGEVLKLDP